MTASTTGIAKSPWIGWCLLCFAALHLQGCVGLALKDLEIRQLKDEIAAVDDTSAYLEARPILGQQYEGRMILGGDAFNRFLAGLDNYRIPLDWPSGSEIHFESTRLLFKDGAPTAVIDAVARDRSRTAEVTLKLWTDLLILANEEKDQLEVTFVVRKILPSIRFNIFRWNEFWLGVAILTVQGDKYAQTLPSTVVPLSVNLPIDVNPPKNSSLMLGDSRVSIEQDLPSFRLGFRYRPIRVVTLKDGVHVFFSMERIY